MTRISVDLVMQMVDMSPEAIGERLHLVDELWQLTTSLRNFTRIETRNDQSSQLPWVAGDGGPLIVMEQALLANWEGSDAPSNGRTVQAESRWGLEVATDYDLACDVNELADVIDIVGGQAFVLSTEGNSSSSWIRGVADSVGMVIEWEYADSEVAVMEAAIAALREAKFSRIVAFHVNSSPLVLFVAAERGEESAYSRQTFDLIPGDYTVRSCRRTNEKSSIVCHVFGLNVKEL